MKKIISPFRFLAVPIAFLTLAVVPQSGCGNPTEEKNDTVTVDSTVPLTGKFFTLSDVHFNPYADTSLFDQLVTADVSQWETILRSSQNDSFGRYGTDSYFKMMDTAFVQMKNVMPNPDFIIITGDFLGHTFQQDYSDVSGIDTGSPAFRPACDSFISKTIRFMALQLHEQFPSTPFFPVLGNNDDYCGDYMIQPNDPFLTLFAEAWAPYFDSANRVGFLQSFPSTGHYTASLPGYPEHVIVGMNTMFFSEKNTSTCMPVDPNSGLDEMGWIWQTVAQCAAKNQKVWFTCHIPPGGDAYGAQKAMGKKDCDKHIKMMWESQFTDSFLQLLNQYPNVITAGIGGHTHMDEYRLLNNVSGQAVSFFHINPSISPIDGNNPAFQLFTYDAPAMVLKDYTSYVFHGISADPASAAWTTQYTFSQAYGVSSVTTGALDSVYTALGTDTVLQKKYLNYYCGGSTYDAPTMWLPYYCCIGNVAQQSFTTCACGSAQ